jgi:hypothetical protein
VPDDRLQQSDGLDEQNAYDAADNLIDAPRNTHGMGKSRGPLTWGFQSTHPKFASHLPNTFSSRTPPIPSLLPQTKFTCREQPQTPSRKPKPPSKPLVQSPK